MKNRGFTLIEILVVIAIIGILAAILLPAGAHALRSAKKKRALTEMNSIKVAALQFYNDHRYMPWPFTLVSGRESWVGDDMWTVGTSDQEAVMLLLTGDNAKGTVYLQIPERSRPSINSMIFNDPWGEPYRVGLDRNSDNSVIPDATIGGLSVNEKVLVYSLGDPEDAEIIKTFDTSLPSP